jgi:CRP/FNR family transcriptional regulator, anaerobic regulatory protein
MHLTERIKTLYPNLRPELIAEIAAHAQVLEIDKGTEILREGQYVKVVPILLSGLIKVFSSHEEKELLLYYIKPGESCIMSFTAVMRDEPSNVIAVTEEDTTAILLPADKIQVWLKLYPEVNSLFFRQFYQRYDDLIGTLNQVLFNKLDQRLYAYLQEMAKLTNKNPVKISHRQIAFELGTAREVISRLTKKLEGEGKIKQHSNSIEILS